MRSDHEFLLQVLLAVSLWYPPDNICDNSTVHIDQEVGTCFPERGETPQFRLVSHLLFERSRS